MLKKIIYIAVWVLILAYMGVALSFVTIKEKQVLCNKIEISILDSTKNFFVEEEDVLQIFRDKKIKLTGIPIENINIAKIEDILYRHPAIKKAEVYKLTVKESSDKKKTEGVLKIDIRQREPIMRIINTNGESYYIDSDARIMTLSDKFSAHVLVVTGHINQPFSGNINKDLSNPTNGDLSNDSLLNDLFTLGRFIWKNPLWKSLTEQVYINENNEIELIPQIGTQLIIFGTLEDYREKFAKLEAIYKQGFSYTGWNKYKDINLKFKNQVICTKIE
ncbi:MAG: hypothetical protein HY958_06545 [Bacteroidia bacterium]|nr:hypothetical protein [Bacteroidia bacterium]